MGYIIEIDPKQLKNISEYDNLLFNLFSGLLPEHLSKEEVELLKQKHGDTWFEDLGYSEPEYKRPNFETLMAQGFAES